MAKRQPYPSDLTDEEWSIIAPRVAHVKLGGTTADHAQRGIVNAIFYILRSGCQCPMLPHDFPALKTVYTYIRNWRVDGTCAQIHDALRKGSPCLRSSSRSQCRHFGQSFRQDDRKSGPRGYDADKKI